MAVFLGIARDKQVKWNLLKGIGYPAKVFMLFVVTGVLTFSVFEEIRELDEGRSKKLSRILSA